MRVLILLPELGLPWKRGGLTKAGVSEETRDLRSYWHVMAVQLETTFKLAGHEANILRRPMWEFTPDLVNALGPDLVLWPHRQASELQGLEMPSLTWMQMHCRWLFTVDPKGWGAEHSAYPLDYSTGDPESGVYEALRDRLVGGNESKFTQPKGGALPAPGYIFFPCQIPHDQNVAQHCDLPEVEVVAALAAWADEAKVRVVFKGHPANPGSMAPLRAVAPESANVSWAEASVHDLIANAAAVYTLNSGVGFEALLHGKPVVTFGRADYDVVGYQRDWELDDGWLNDLWGRTQFLREGASSAGAPQYRQFIDFYCRQHAVDLTDEAGLAARLAKVVVQGEALVAQRAAA